MFKSKILNIIGRCFLFVFFFFIGVVSVNAKTLRTESLDLTSHPTEDKLADEGWSWNNDTKTLKLEDANFEITDMTNTSKPCIEFSKSDNITVIFEGTNNLTADKKSVFYGSGHGTGSLTFQSTNNGTLNLKIKTYNTIGGDNIGDTINYPYNLNIKSGTINSEGGILADGVVSISGGNLNINTQNFPSTQGLYVVKQVNITGGNIYINASSAPIMVTGLTNETDYTDGVIISGGNITLNSTATRVPTIHAGALQHKNIVINGGNFTLSGDLGIYANLGNIYVNRIDSLNADNVKNKDELFKVSSNNPSNEVIYGNADYSKVDEAINKAKKLNKNDYKDFSAVEDAIASVVRGKNVLAQIEVDAMAKAINDAIDSLELIDQVKNDTALDEQIENPNTSDSGLVYILITLFSMSSIIITTNIYKKMI